MISVFAVSAAAQSPTFAVRNYPLFGNKRVVVDLNGNGSDFVGQATRAVTLK